MGGSQKPFSSDWQSSAIQLWNKIFTFVGPQHMVTAHGMMVGVMNLFTAGLNYAIGPL